MTQIVATVIVACGLAGTLLSAQAPARIGSFDISRTIDPMTDGDDSSIASFGQEAVFALSWKCIDGRPDVALAWGSRTQLIGATLKVQHRMGTEAPVTQTWSMHPGGSGAMIPQDRAPIFTAAAKRHASVRIRVWDHKAMPLFDVIPLEKFTQALEQLPCVAKKAIR